MIGTRGRFHRNTHHDAQARKVEEMERFREAAGIGARSTAIWAN